MTNSRELSQRLISARKMKGLTQFAAAKKAGIDKTQFREMESGEGNPKLKTMEKALKALGISMLIS